MLKLISDQWRREYSQEHTHTHTHTHTSILTVQVKGLFSGKTMSTTDDMGGETMERKNDDLFQLYTLCTCRKSLTKYNCFVNWIRVRGNPPSKIVSKANIRGAKGEEHIISHTVSDTWAIWRVPWPSAEPWLTHTHAETHTHTHTRAFFYACTQTAGWVASGPVSACSWLVCSDGVFNWV